MKSWSLLALAAILIPSLTGCVAEGALLAGGTGLYDEAKAQDGVIAGRTATLAESPFGATGAAWVEPRSEFPYYLAQVVDPFNYPHMLWRAFYTVWTVDINPLYHLTEEPVEDWNKYVQPIGETVTYDYTPTPHGGGEAFKYWQSRSDAITSKFENSWYSLKYHFMNTNSDRWPYDNWHPGQIETDKTTMHRTIDLHFFNYDWDDAFID
ncbi:MAG: hypothetical protein R3F20_08300 [Planctomycetota bacterium]